MSGMAGAARVLGGWTGDVTVTIGAVDAVVTPRSRESAVSIWVRLARAAQRVHGGEWSVYETGGHLGMRSTLAFDTEASGNTATRLGHTGPFGVGVDQLLDSAHQNGIYPNAVIAATAGRESTQAPVMADGAASNRSVRTAGDAVVQAWGTMLEVSGELMGELVAGETYDIWVAGRLIERVLITETSREKWGRLSSLASIRCRGRQVVA